MTSTARPSALEKRSSAPPPAAKPPCTIHSSAIIADKAQITGPHRVKIGENAIIHPYAKLKAETGPIRIGKGSVVWENAVLSAPAAGLSVEEYVTIETGALVEASSIGTGTQVGIKSVVGKGAVIGKWCKIAPMERVEEDEELEDFTVVLGDGRRRVGESLREHEEVREARVQGLEKEVEVLRKLVPNAGAKWAG